MLVPVFEAGGAGGGGGAGGAPPAGGGGGAAGAGGAGGAAGAGGAGGTAGEAETAGVRGAGGAAWGLTCPMLAGVGSYIPGTRAWGKRHSMLLKVAGLTQSEGTVIDHSPDVYTHKTCTAVVWQFTQV